MTKNEYYQTLEEVLHMVIVTVAVMAKLFLAICSVDSLTRIG